MAGARERPGALEPGEAGADDRHICAAALPAARAAAVPGGSQSATPAAPALPISLLRVARPTSRGENTPGRPEVRYQRLLSCSSRPAHSWMWPKTASRGACPRSCAGSLAAEAGVEVPFRGECTTSTPPSGQAARRSAASSSLRSKLQLQGVVGSRAEPEEAHAVDLGAAAMQHGGGVPALAGGAQSVLGLVVAGTRMVGRWIGRSASMVSSSPS